MEASGSNSFKTASEQGRLDHIGDVSTVLLIFMFPIMLLSFSSNLATLIIILKSRALRNNAQNMCMCSLCAANVLVSIAGSLTAATYLAVTEGSWNCDQCIAYQFTEIALNSAVGSLVIIAIHRFHSIVLMHRPKLRHRTILLLIAGSWTFAVVEQLLELFLNVSKEIWLLVSISFLFILPLVVVASLYTKVILLLWKSADNAHMTENTHERKKRATKMMVIIMAVFSVSWLFFYTVELISVLHSQEQKYDVLQLASITIVLLNGVLDMAIFNIYNKDLATAWKHMLCFCKKDTCNENSILPFQSATV